MKAALGKLVLHQPVRDLCRELEREFGVRTLPVSLAHVLQLGALAQHHGDPLDRLLIAQAQVEGLTIVTRDAEFSRYGVPIVAA